MVVLSVLGVIYFQITGYVGKIYFEEVNQRLYGSIADTTVSQVKPLVDGKVDTLAIQDIMHSLMVINPSLEVYLLDTEGNIITHVAPYKRVVLTQVDLKPIKKFIAQKDNERPVLVKGDDPRSEGKKKVFSAAPIMDNGSINGYMYIILASEEQASVSSSLFGSYCLQLGAILFLIALFGALIIGLLGIWFLTRNLRETISIFRRFKEGDLKARVPKENLGDLPPLGETFNEMADTLVANIEQLKSVESLRRELIANVSHDLRTPLAVVQGYVETLQIKQDKLASEERSYFLKTILKSVNNLKRLISQLFEYSKLEAKQVEPQKEPFFIGELAQDTFHKYKLLAEQKEIKIKLDIPEKLPLVFADISLVERVFQNLLDNALKFTPNGGEIALEIVPQDGAVQVSIVDNGPGIPEEQQAYIFDRYYRDTKEKKRKQGVGLGLAIVKKILELHDSTIRVKSKLQEGTAFIFQLPVHVA